MTSPGALQTLDVLVGGSVQEPPRSAPPAAPVIGECYIVAEDATGAWAGKSHHVAAWTSGGWRLIAPVEGMTMYERGSGTWMTFRDGGWEAGIVRGSSVVIGGQQVVGSRGSAIESPSGGSVVDGEARSCIDAILDTLRQHGLIEA